jgi:hypothetical protein
MTAGVDEIAMCMACQEMELYYAYLDALEAEKRKAQPWQCEVTIIPEGHDPAAAMAGSSSAPKAKPATSAKPGFACDEPE